MADMEFFKNLFKAAPFSIISKFINSGIPSDCFSISAPPGPQHYRICSPPQDHLLFPLLSGDLNTKVSFCFSLRHLIGLWVFFPPSSLLQRIENRKPINKINVSWLCFASVSGVCNSVPHRYNRGGLPSAFYHQGNFCCPGKLCCWITIFISPL